MYVQFKDKGTLEDIMNVDLQISTSVMNIAKHSHTRFIKIIQVLVSKV